MRATLTPEVWRPFVVLSTAMAATFVASAAIDALLLRMRLRRAMERQRLREREERQEEQAEHPVPAGATARPAAGVQTVKVLPSAQRLRTRTAVRH
ncbi:hypothetical protein [Streptomyces sp. GC420]|uniref:hypothetical protein n=1 Tax=Streptomyces sp. GC420 TaxID=2697568 RepID=UPI0014151562|nr:hypothetical protein [Streptomyces sp. GC420]NBM19643.1 hypothetical protein [Streptomyces sp. GC420]